MTGADPLSSAPAPGVGGPALVRWTHALEHTPTLDGLAGALRPAAEALLADPGRAAALQGMWLGHAVHPLLTDVPVGTWTSALLLDLLGGKRFRPASQRLIGLGIVAAVPTALTGLAEFGESTQTEQRVGAVHALANTAALGLMTASWSARRRGRYFRGFALATAGAAAVGVGGYLGGHLTSARKVSSRHPAFDADSLTPPGPTTP